jgi:hypothetical protein
MELSQDTFAYHNLPGSQRNQAGGCVQDLEPQRHIDVRINMEASCLHGVRKIG